MNVKGYAVAKDGLYLVKLFDNGVRELVDGELVSVPTGVYSSSRYDATVYETRTQAHAIANKINGQVYAIGRAGWILDKEPT